jgi:putative Mg2+ transporter-C (MgtC) family protein
MFHDQFNLEWRAPASLGLRLVGAIVLGGAIGWERERHRRSAGLRTHILVAVGAAAFMISGMEVSRYSPGSDPARIIQGIAIGIGFLGAGAILKHPDEHRIEGLTTAAGIWTTAAVGAAMGAGWLVFAAVLTALILIVLAVLRRIE